MALPPELLDAVAKALDREASASDVGQRARLLAATRTTIEEWLRGRLTTEEAVALLRTATAD
jgi:hypothetical protein